MKISQPGYSRDRGYNVTSFLMRHNVKSGSQIGSGNRFGERELEISRGNYHYDNKAEDPVFENLNKMLDKTIFKRYGDAIEGNVFCLISWKYADGMTMVMVTKSRGYTINGRKMSKANILGILSRVIYRSCFIRSAEIMDGYLEDLLEITPNVRYALENKTPYKYYDSSHSNPYRRIGIEVRFNTKRISKTHCALELSENIWASIANDDLDKFLNHFRLGKNRGKRWINISPSKLWEELFGKPATESEYAMMKAWLRQNRTDKQIESRSMGLIDEVCNENENFHKFKTEEGKIGMIIRGSLTDWVLFENSASKGSPQRVNIYAYKAHDNITDETAMLTGISTTNKKFLHGWLSGPICVNNSVGKVSLGDQFVSRAYTLMNDKLAVKMVGTLRGHVNSKEESQINRIDMKLFKKWDLSNTKKRLQKRQLMKEGKA